MEAAIIKLALHARPLARVRLHVSFIRNDLC